MGKKVNVVAPTERAAFDITGSTTWSYAGWIPEHMKKPLDIDRMRPKYSLSELLANAATKASTQKPRLGLL